jgi:hypothetical protein
MANEYVTEIRPRDWFREGSIGYDPTMQVTQIGDLWGIPLPKKTDEGYTATFVVPVGTLTTGLTFSGLLVADGLTASDYGKVVRLGITVKRLIDDETPSFASGAATEATVDVTLKASGTLLEAFTVAVANAALDSIAVGNQVAIRLRRVSSASQDTATGRVVLVGAFAVQGT